MKIKKIFLSVVVVAFFGLYAAYKYFGGGNANVYVTPLQTPSGSQPSVSPVSSVTNYPTNTPSNTSTPIPTATPKAISGYKDGTYTGNVADAYFGNVQIKTVVQNGKITDIQFLQYPNDRSTSIRINTGAMPILKSEAIQNQNAQVEIVSGATQTSQAFIESLTSALAMAK